MCSQKASAGGYSRLVSSLSIHNVILEKRPDLLEALYNGYPRWVFEKTKVTTYSVPVFSVVEDMISCSYYGVEEAAEKIGEEVIMPEVAPDSALVGTRLTPGT